MPRRLARSSVSTATPRTASKKHRKRQLDAYAIAGKLATEKANLRSHRLGVAEDDEPKQKRRRTGDTDEDQESDDGAEDELRSRQKRRKQSEDDDVEFGSDSEGNEWVAGGLMDDDDDESIDSDEAFGESDEERFEGFTFRGSRSNSQRNRKPKSRQPPSLEIADDFDLDEGHSSVGEGEDDFGDEGVDLATMLDDDEAEDEEDGDDSDSSEDDGHSESASGEEDDEASEEDDSQRHARLQDFVEGLNKKSSTDVADADVAADDMITLDDLLEGADLDSKTLATLKPKRKSHAPQMVKPLLPKRQQDAINRQIATEKAKEQLDRWRDTVIQNRRAEFLSFPLKHADESGPTAKDTFAPVQRDVPSTDLEANIHKIMEESGMLAKLDGKSTVDDLDNELLKAEELAIKKLPVEEVLRRRAELRRTRELLFREEIKAKRIAKIKSKSYRRVHRKERERLAEKERMLMDPEGYAEDVLNEDEQDCADRRRAEARMNAKHKTSKWAKSLRATDRAVWDTDARDGAIDMARRQEELKRRIAGKDVHDEDGDDSFSDNLDDSHEGEDDLAARISRLRDADEQAASGLAGMKFMRAAENRRKVRNDEALAEIEAENGLSNDATADDIEDEGLGRAIFGPRPASNQQDTQTREKKPELEEGDVTDEDRSDGERPDAPMATRAGKSTNEKSKLTTKNQNPSAVTSTGTAASKPNVQLQEKQKPEEVSVWLTAPREKKSKLDRKLARLDDEAIINTNVTNRKPGASPIADPTPAREEVTAPNTSGWTQVRREHTSDNESASDHEKDDPILTQAERNAAFHARAFAGDDVALQFDAEKDAMAESEDEKEINNNMPGWGSWTGAGLSKSVRKAAQRARHNPLYKTKVDGVRAQDRKDAKLENVIISEKNDRKGKKYLAPMLPHQYERKEEYERSLRMPIGPEWATKEVFQRNTRPRVVVKPGVIIEPMSRPLV